MDKPSAEVEIISLIPSRSLTASSIRVVIVSSTDLGVAPRKTVDTVTASTSKLGNTSNGIDLDAESMPITTITTINRLAATGFRANHSIMALDV